MMITELTTFNNHQNSAYKPLFIFVINAIPLILTSLQLLNGPFISFVQMGKCWPW